MERAEEGWRRMGNKLKQGKDIKREMMNPVVSLLQIDIWSGEPISVRSLPLVSHFNKLLVFEC